MGSLTDRTALVTGASRGIGRQIALELARDDAAVALAATSDGIHETADRIGDAAPTIAVKTDVTSEESVEAAIQATRERFGGLDILVNNAGVAGPTAGVEDISVEEWEATMDVNVTGMFRCVKHAAPLLRDSQHGRIVNISSISGKRPLEDRTPYTASKMAVIGLTRTLAFEFGPDDVTVNAICPGATRGPRIDRVIEKQAERRGETFEQAKRAVFTGDTALGRLTDASDIAGMVAYLASDRAENITAQDINVDAGSVWY